MLYVLKYKKEFKKIFKILNEADMYLIQLEKEKRKTELILNKLRYKLDEALRL